MARRYVVISIPESGLFYDGKTFRTGNGNLMTTEKMEIFRSWSEADAHRFRRQLNAKEVFCEPITMVTVEVDLKSKGITYLTTRREK